MQIDSFLSAIATCFQTDISLRLQYKKVISNLCCSPLSWKQNKMAAKQHIINSSLYQILCIYNSDNGVHLTREGDPYCASPAGVTFRNQENKLINRLTDCEETGRVTQSSRNCQEHTPFHRSRRCTSCVVTMAI